MQRNSKMDLFCLALLNNLDTARRMIYEGIDVNSHFSIRGFCDTYLKFAVLKGNPPAVQFLLEQGADYNYRNPVSELSILYTAVCCFNSRKERYEILKLLLEKGAGFQYEAGGIVTTPFLYAVQCTSLEWVKLFLEHAADIKKPDLSGRTAMYHATRNSRVDVLQFVVDQGLDIKQVDHSSYSALHCAARFGNPNGCEVLLKNGADVGRRTESGKTPISLAVRGEHPSLKVIRVLLEYGADMNAKVQGKSVLQIAVHRGRHKEVLELLIQQLARMSYLNLSINQCDRRIIRSDRHYRKYYEKCSQELHDMGETNNKFYNDVSIRDIFLNSNKVISGYASNEELVEALEMRMYEERFPTYLALWKEKFYVEVDRQRSRRAAAQTLSNLFKFNDKFHIVNQAILSYMSDDDLTFLHM